jgi:hypothetical protein
MKPWSATSEKKKGFRVRKARKKIRRGVGDLQCV